MTVETVEQLLARAAAAGVAVEAVGADTLRLHWPATPDPLLREAFRTRKSEVLAAVRPRARAVACAGCGLVYFAEPTLCYWCRRARDGGELGPPCQGCGEACEQCLGDDAPEAA